jgi:3-methyladenine DNA glycosylase AlkD
VGVRIPVLRRIAKDVSKHDVMSYLENPTLSNYEEIMIYGLVLGYAKLDFKSLKKYLRKFIPYIDNWSICDTVCSNLKMFYCNETYLPFLLKYLNSKKEYELRFVIVMLLDYYLDYDVRYVFQLIDQIQYDSYYVNMAIAWLISIAYKKYPNETISYLKDNHLSSFTYKKAIQKIIELKGTSREEKEFLKTI